MVHKAWLTWPPPTVSALLLTSLQQHWLPFNFYNAQPSFPAGHGGLRESLHVLLSSLNKLYLPLGLANPSHHVGSLLKYHFLIGSFLFALI